MDLVAFCNHNADYQRLLNKFKQDYIAAYNKRRVKDRLLVKPYLYRNFGYWYYSDACTEQPFSPAEFINSDIHHKVDEKATVYPVCTPVFNKNKLMDIRFTFKAYKVENHPFIQDMRTFIGLYKDKNIADTLIPADMSNEEIQTLLLNESSDFAFHEGTYWQSLDKVCTQLSLVSYDDKQGPLRISVNEPKCEAFFALTASEQIKTVVDAFINTFVNTVKQNNIAAQSVTLAKLRLALKKSMELDDFMEIYFSELYSRMNSAVEHLKKLKSLNSFIGLDDDFDDDDFDDDDFDEDDFDDDDFDEDDILDEDSLTNIIEEMKEFSALSAFSSLTQRFFFWPLGAYMQIIQPYYDSTYNGELDDDHIDFNKNLDEDNAVSNMIFLNYMRPPSCYTITPMGTQLYRSGRKERSPLYNDIDEENYQTILDDMLLS